MSARQCRNEVELAACLDGFGTLGWGETGNSFNQLTVIRMDPLYRVRARPTGKQASPWWIRRAQRRPRHLLAEALFDLIGGRAFEKPERHREYHNWGFEHESEPTVYPCPLDLDAHEERWMRTSFRDAISHKIRHRELHRPLDAPLRWDGAR